MQQATVTIGPKSQVVIPKKVREVVPGLRPGTKVIIRALDTSSVLVEVPAKNWVNETYGVHKKIWQGVDATKYILKLRAEWERKIK